MCGYHFNTSLYLFTVATVGILVSLQRAVGASSDLFVRKAIWPTKWLYSWELTLLTPQGDCHAVFVDRPIGERVCGSSH